MLEVKVTLHHAVTGEVREIARMTITNDGSDDLLHGSYDVELSESSLSARIRRRVAYITGHRRDASVWLLVRKAIDMVF